MGHLSGEDFRCNIGESGGVFKWPTQVVEVVHLSGWCDIGDLGGGLKWPTQVVEVAHLSG